MRLKEKRGKREYRLAYEVKGEKGGKREYRLGLRG
jgi:hypothetical protein